MRQPFTLSLSFTKAFFIAYYYYFIFLPEEKKWKSCAPPSGNGRYAIPRNCSFVENNDGFELEEGHYSEDGIVGRRKMHRGD